MSSNRHGSIVTYYFDTIFSILARYQENSAPYKTQKDLVKTIYKTINAILSGASSIFFSWQILVRVDNLNRFFLLEQNLDGVVEE